MIEPDRKNGDFVSETSLGSPLGFIGGCLAVLVYAYYFFDEWLDFYFWFYVLLIFVVKLVIIVKIMDWFHEKPDNKRFYFRSGTESSEKFYSQIEIEKINSKQETEPQPIHESQDGKQYWRYKNRCWISENNVEIDEIKADIEKYLEGF